MKKNILIVEDDISIAELERDYLEINGFDVRICTDGTEGLQAIQTGEYDLAVLDIMLPGMDGLEILRRIRSQIDIPVLLVSAKKDEVDKIRGLGLGADDYITKPFSPGELVARVQAHLTKIERIRSRYHAPTSPSVLTVRGLRIQKDAHRVFINDREIVLAQKEYELLVYLASNPNRMFSREELFEKIWGMDALGDVATVTVHIGRIRDKIEENPSNPQYIETVWGAGYRFRA